MFDLLDMRTFDVVVSGNSELGEKSPHGHALAGAPSIDNQRGLCCERAMSTCYKNWIMAENNVGCFRKAGGRQELLDSFVHPCHAGKHSRRLNNQGHP